MDKPNWKQVYGEKTLACFLEQAEVKSWLGSDLVLRPGEAAVIIKDGKADEVMTEERRRLGGWVDRNLPTVKKWLGLDTVYQVLMVNVSPLELHFGANTLTLDRQVVPGEVAVRFSVIPESAALVAGLLGDRKAAAVTDILERVRPELCARVFEPAIGGMRLDEMRGNLAFIRDLESRAREELQRILGGWGLHLESMTVVWGLSEQECAEIEQKSRQIEDDIVEFNHNRTLREMERMVELARFAQEMAQEERRRIMAGEIELESMQLDAELSAEQKVQLQRQQLAKIDAELQILGLDMQKAALQVDREKNRVDLERKEAELRLITDDQLRRDAQDMLDFQTIQGAKAERDREERMHQLDLMRQQADMQLQQAALQLGSLERILAQAISAGVADAKTLQAMIGEQTRVTALNRGAEVAGQFFGAEAARNSLEGHLAAEDRERAHQYETTRLAAEMMQAAKQQAPNAFMMTPGMAASPPPSINVVNAPQGGGGAQQETGPACPHCGAGIKREWKVCPFCTKTLGG